MHRSVRPRWPLLALGLLFAPAAWSQVQIDSANAPAGRLALETLAPPVATRLPVETKIHGRTLVDPYAWLRGKEKPEVVAYLEAENRYTAAVMKPTEALQERLYKELLGRIKETDLTVPSRRDDYWYYSRTEQGKQYPIQARKKGSLTAPEEVLLDLNAAAEGQKYFRLGGFQVSPDHSRLAYLYDTDGSERFTLAVKDLATGKLLPDSVRDLSFGLAWANDNKTVFYVVADQNRRPYRLMRHVLGSDPQQDVAVYEEPDEAFTISIGRTRSDGYLVLSSGATKTSERRVLEADRPDGQFRLVQAREKGIEYSLDHHGDRFYIRTNVGAADFRVVSAPVATPGREHW